MTMLTGYADLDRRYDNNKPLNESFYKDVTDDAEFGLVTILGDAPASMLDISITEAILRDIVKHPNLSISEAFIAVCLIMQEDYFSFKKSLKVSCISWLAKRNLFSFFEEEKKVLEENSAS